MSQLKMAFQSIFGRKPEAKAYDVRMLLGLSMGSIKVPPEYRRSMCELLEQQLWIIFVNNDPDSDRIGVILAPDCDFAPKKAQAALEKLCESVMTPPLDMDVWGDVFQENTAGK